MSQNEGKFVLKKVTPFAELSDTVELPESDLCFQDDNAIYQFKFEKPETERKEIVMPGIYVMHEAMGAVSLKKTELRSRDLLTSVVSTQAIVNEAKTFFSRLHVYEELGEQKARKILLYSDPGMGKTASITHFCLNAIKEDPGTVVVIWPTSEVGSDDVLHFMGPGSEFHESTTRMILIIEDIGGGEREGNGGSRAVDSAMLDLLDGLQVTFKAPTFIIATTNYPQNLLSALADRPGRFDLILPLKPPSFEEKVKLTEFIAKRSLTDEEKESLNMKGAESFSVAHLKEVVIRSKLHDKSIPVVIKELVEHRKNFKKAFEEKDGNVGFFGRD